MVGASPHLQYEGFFGVLSALIKINSSKAMQDFYSVELEAVRFDF